MIAASIETPYLASRALAMPFLLKSKFRFFIAALRFSNSSVVGSSVSFANLSASFPVNPYYDTKIIKKANFLSFLWHNNF